MPVIQVFAPPVDDITSRLASLCSSVASELRLAPADVVATYVPVAETVVPGAADGASWPVVILHGSLRPPEDMARARDCVQSEVRGWFGEDSSAWVTWQLQV